MCSLVFPAGGAVTMPQRLSVEKQAYSVPLIQPDLRREETIQQITDTLQHLQTVSNDIFNRYGIAEPPVHPGVIEDVWRPLWFSCTAPYNYKALFKAELQSSLYIPLKCIYCK